MTDLIERLRACKIERRLGNEAADALAAQAAEIERLQEKIKRIDEGDFDGVVLHMDAANDRADALAARVAELEAALQPFATAPEHGLWGGPMVQAVLTYEDGTDENTKRHKGSLSPDCLQARPRRLPAQGSRRGGRRGWGMTQERSPVSPEALARPDEIDAAWTAWHERHGDLATQLAAAREAGRLEGEAAGYRRGMEEAAQMVERDEIDSSVRLDPQKHKNLSEWINAQRAAAIRSASERPEAPT